MIEIIKIRKFNQVGLEKFKEALIYRAPGLFNKLKSIYSDAAFSEDIGIEFSWDDSWNTRKELATGLWSSFIQFPNFEREADDPQLWNWLSCRLLASIYGNVEGEATNKAAKKESLVRWIVEEGKLRQHRHLILSAFTAYKINASFGDDYSLSQLVQPIRQPGEVVERISGKIELSHGEVALLSTWLYVDKSKSEIRKNITSDGEPQQLSKYFNQIEKTVDYQSMTAAELLEMLPSKFSKWTALSRAERLP